MSLYLAKNTESKTRQPVAQLKNTESKTASSYEPAFAAKKHGEQDSQYLWAFIC